MLSGSTRKRLIEDIDFRSHMKEAAGSEVALPLWVLKQLVKSNYFQSLVGESMVPDSQSPEGKPAIGELSNSKIESNLTTLLDSEDAQERRELFARLNQNDRPLRFLIGEIIQRYNNRFTVLSGLKTLLKYLPQDDQKGPSEQRPVWSPDVGRANPLLSLMIASFLGVSTLTTGAFGYKYWRSLDLKITVKPDEEAWKKTAEDISKLSPVVRLNMPDQVRLGNVQCSSCNGPATINGKLVIALKDKLPDLKFNGTLVLPSPGEGGKTSNALNVNLHIPELSTFNPFPNGLTVDSVPKYRVDNLPPSYIVLAPRGTGQMNVWFPSFYDTATTCNVELALQTDNRGKPILSGEIKNACQPSTPKQLTNPHFGLPLSAGSGWHFVPEIGASVKIEELRSGVIGFRKSSYRISIQAVPYPNLQLAGAGTNPRANPAMPTGTQPANPPATSPSPQPGSTFTTKPEQTSGGVGENKP